MMAVLTASSAVVTVFPAHAGNIARAMTLYNHTSHGWFEMNVTSDGGLHILEYCVKPGMQIQFRYPADKPGSKYNTPKSGRADVMNKDCKSKVNPSNSLSVFWNKPHVTVTLENAGSGVFRLISKQDDQMSH